jgi:G3E family GTPase
MVSKFAVRAEQGARVSVTLICGPPRAGKTTLIDHVRRYGVTPDHSLFELPFAQDPLQLVSALISGSTPARVDTIVAVIDAESILSDFCCQDLVAERLPAAAGDGRSWVDAMAEQIECADLLIMNKVDRVSAEQRGSIRVLLAALNPDAQIIESEYGFVPMDELLATGRFDLDRAYHRSAWSAVLSGADLSRVQALGLHAFAYRRRIPFHPHRLMQFLNRPCPGVIRARGTFWLATRMDWQGELSQVGPARKHRPVSTWWATALESRELDARQATGLTGLVWDEKFGDRRQEIAFIGLHEDLDENALTESLDACLLTASEMRRGREVWQAFEDPFPPWGLQPAR